MNKSVNFVSAIVVLSSGMDTVIFETDLPSPVPGVTSKPAHFVLHVEHDKGVDYVRRYFNIEPMVVDRYGCI